MTAAEVMGYDIPPDTAEAPCAACGSATLGGGVRRTVEGSLLMLCSNAAACARRYRMGFTPELFASVLRQASVAWRRLNPEAKP